MKDRVREFIRYYLTDTNTRLNGKQSAIKAGYSDKCADVQASRLLAKDKVKAEIEGYFKRVELSNEQIVNGIQNIAQNGKIEANRLRAYELLSKVKGILKDVSTQTTVNVVDTINAIKQETIQTETEQSKSVLL
jgi:phage terminase small subunit